MAHKRERDFVMSFRTLNSMISSCILAATLFGAGCESPIMPNTLAGQAGPPGPAGTIGEQGLAGATGKRGHVGPRGPAGPDAGIVYFNMSVSTVRNFDFPFFPTNSGGSSPTQFEPATTNASNRPYSSFLVPFDGTISDLTIRADVTAVADTTPNFTFTVYSSAATLDTPAATTGWTATALAQSTGAFTVNNGASRTIVSQNLTDSASVSAGSVLTVVVGGTGYNDFDLQPAKFATSFRYTPN